MPAIALVIAAAKAGCFIAGSLVHEVNEVMKRFGVDHEDSQRASGLSLIKDEQLGLQLQETPKESPSPSNALIRYASREVVLSSSSRALAILSNDALALEASFNVIEDFFPIEKSFDFFAARAWFLARFIALTQSALHLVITDMKMALSSFIGSFSESVVEKKAAISMGFLIQASSSRLMCQIIVILKEAIRLLKSRYAKSMSMSNLLGQTFPAGIRGKDRYFDTLPDSNSFGDRTLVEVDTRAQHSFAMVITCVKHILAKIFSHSTSLFRPLQHHGLKVLTLVLLLCVSISLVGWSIPMMIFEGGQSEQSFLQKSLILEAVSEVQVEAAITYQCVYILDGISNALSLTESINNFDDLQPVSMAMGTSERQVDDSDNLDLGLAELNPSWHLCPSNDVSSTSMTALQSSNPCPWDDIATPVSFDDWNSIRPNSGHKHGFGTALDLESSLSIYADVQELLPSKDYASCRISTEHFDGYSLSTVADEAFELSALQNYSVVEELELGIAFDGATSTTPTIATGPPREHSTIRISSLSKEVDEYFNPMQVDDRYSESMAVHVGLDHPGLVMLFMSIEVYHCIQSVSPPSICELGDLSCDRFGTSNFSSVVAAPFDGYSVCCAVSATTDKILIFTSSFVARAPPNQSYSYVESLGSSILLRSASDGNASSLQMIVANSGASDEISSIHCPDFDRSVASVAEFSAAATPSQRFGVLEESKSLDIFRELRRLACIFLMLAYRNSDGDGATDEDGVLLSSDSEMPTGTNLDLEDVCDDEMICADEENGADEALLRNTNSKPSRHELTALHSELGRHWKSPSKRRMRRSSRFRSRPKYFEPTWA